MDGSAWLDDVRLHYRQHKADCDRALAQIGGDDLFRVPLRGSNSIAVQMKHVGGNLRSRWRDFLTTDGEKPDRHRDTEFTAEGETPESVRAAWDTGWRIALDELDALEPGDLERTITIRGEPHTVTQAILRNLTHVAYHAGQIVELARHFAGDAWQTLSIAPGKSDEFNAAKRAEYGPW